MLSHDNISWTALACCQILSVRETSDVVSYLPLSHIAAQIIVSRHAFVMAVYNCIYISWFFKF